jgi:sirohydrochlorin ferrochelatase
MTPVLIACSHGTSSLAGRAAISAVVDRVRALLPQTRVEEAFVDVQQPELDDVVAHVVQTETAIVVPLLLSTGFHTKVDIARAVTDAGGRATATPTLGPHPLLADLLAARLRAAGLAPGDAVVLAAAGSSDAAASLDVNAMAELLAARVPVPVTAGYAAGAGPRIATAVAQARDRGASRVIAASYVLAPGYFADVIGRAGADVATAPLAPDDAVARVIVERYLAAVPSLAVAV